MHAIDPAAFRHAMGRTAAGVTVVTSDGAHGRVGVTVSSLSSLSLEPPSVLFCLHRDSRCLPVLLANGVFAANILAQGQQRVADSFAGLVPELREDRFGSGTASPPARRCCAAPCAASTASWPMCSSMARTASSPVMWWRWKPMPNTRWSIPTEATAGLKWRERRPPVSSLSSKEPLHAAA